MAGGLIFLLVGPSGTGKTTLIKRALGDLPSLNHYVTYTTRPPRGDEKDGIDYHFVARAAFKALREQRKLVECQRFYGHWYGSLRDDIEAVISGDTDRISSTDVLGAKKLQRLYPKNVVTVFIVPRSAETLRARIKERPNQTSREIQLREERFDMEMTYAGRFKYAVHNDVLEEAVLNVESIIRAERCARYARTLR
jgi:guanylate kinase